MKETNSKTFDNELPVISVAVSDLLPDNDHWCNRFTIRSASSDREYIVSQNKKKQHWGCSCPGWKAHRRCKHLSTLGLPNLEVPYPVNLVKT
jgi:hypothetical protein